MGITRRFRHLLTGSTEDDRPAIYRCAACERPIHSAAHLTCPACGGKIVRAEQLDS